jgi:hypothetical protein
MKASDPVLFLIFTFDFLIDVLVKVFLPLPPGRKIWRCAYPD